MIKWNLVFEFVLTIIIPLLYLLNIQIIAVTPNTVTFSLALNVLGAAIAAMGLAIWIITLINLGKSFGVLPQKQKRVKSGLYKYFNHPMYIGIWCAFLGLSLANNSWPGLVFLNLIMTPLLFFRAYYEDRNLTD